MYKIKVNNAPFQSHQKNTVSEKKNREHFHVRKYLTAYMKRNKKKNLISFHFSTKRSTRSFQCKGRCV